MYKSFFHFVLSVTLVSSGVLISITVQVLLTLSHTIISGRLNVVLHFIWQVQRYIPPYFFSTTVSDSWWLTTLPCYFALLICSYFFMYDLSDIVMSVIQVHTTWKDDIMWNKSSSFCLHSRHLLSILRLLSRFLSQRFWAALVLISCSCRENK